MFVRIPSILLTGAAVAHACDLCALSTIDDLRNGSGLSLGLDARVTQLDRIQDNGKRVSNEGNQYMTSTVVQATVAYPLVGSWSLQAIVPYINRSYRRIEGGEPETGTVSGLGDVVVAVTGTIARVSGPTAGLRLVGTLGIKAPTGDPDRLKEVNHEVEPPPRRAGERRPWP